MHHEIFFLNMTVWSLQGRVYVQPVTTSMRMWLVLCIFRWRCYVCYCAMLSTSKGYFPQCSKWVKLERHNVWAVMCMQYSSFTFCIILLTNLFTALIQHPLLNYASKTAPCSASHLCEQIHTCVWLHSFL